MLPTSLIRFGWRARLRWTRLRGKAMTRDMSTLVPFYEHLWRDAARTLGAHVTELAPGLWRVARGASSTLIHNYIVQMDDPVVLRVAGDKALCHRLFTERGLRVPEYAVYTARELGVAEAFMKRFPGSSFVVKPADGTSGARGVTTHVVGRRACRNASVLASLYGSRLLIERWYPGESYRLLVLDGEMIHASRRRGCWVAGDGTSTIQTLLGPKHRSTTSQRELAVTLEAQGLSLESVPEAGRAVLVRNVTQPIRGTVEIRTVFDEDVTDAIGPGLRDDAVRAAEAIGSSFAGVDIITCDPTTSLGESGGVINEINTTPGLHHHHGLTGRAAPKAPALAVLERLLCHTRESRGASLEPPVSITL